MIKIKYKKFRRFVFYVIKTIFGKLGNITKTSKGIDLYNKETKRIFRT